jgi:hypothetical protein
MIEGDSHLTGTSTQEATLTSLAMLKVRADAKQRQDYIDYLRPFVVHVLAKGGPFPVSRERTQQLVLAEFGLNIPVRGCELVLKRLARSGYLEKEHGNFSLSRKLPSSGINESRADARRRGRAVIARLCSFGKDIYGKEHTIDEGTQAFLRFLSHFSITCLKTYATGTALPELKRKNGTDIALVGAFIKHALETDPNLFEDIILLVKGHMLANALTCPDLETVQKKFRDVLFFLDTPIVLDLLGLHGREELKAAIELLTAVTRLGGKFEVFEHTLDETDRVLDFCEKHIENPKSTTRVLQHARQTRRTTSDIALIRSAVRVKLQEFGVVVRRTPKYTKTYQIDEVSLQQVLEGTSKYGNPNARDTDINSIRSIYALREDSRPRLLEEAKAVLVTPNWRLAKSAYEFGQQFEESKEISPVITEFSLGNIAWLKAPLEAEDLPRLELIASCYAVMEPGSEFWSKFLAEVDKLRKLGKITPAEHEFLRADFRVPQELMSLTLGSEEALTEQTVTEIRDHITRELTTKKDLEIRAKEEELENVSLSRKKYVLQHQETLGRIDTVSAWLGRIVAGAVAGGLIVAIVAGLVFPFLPITSFPDAVQWTLFAAAVLLGVATLGNLIFGVAVKDVWFSIKGAVHSKTKRLILKAFGMQEALE